MSETKGQVENLLQELGKKIDDLVEEVKDAKDDLREEVDEKIEELKAKKAKLQEEFDEFKTKEKWHEAKEHFTTAVDELKKAVQTAFRKD